MTVVLAAIAAAGIVLEQPHCGRLDVLFAVAGLVRPQVVVSAGALASLDDGELAAGLDHEAGHIARRHRFVMLLAVGLHAAGRVVPGGGRGVRELAFHLERDADRWALCRHSDRVAPASVICNAGTADRTRSSALVGLGGTDVRERVGQVLDRTSRTTRRAYGGQCAGHGDGGVHRTGRRQRARCGGFRCRCGFPQRAPPASLPARGAPG